MINLLRSAQAGVWPTSSGNDVCEIVSRIRCDFRGLIRNSIPGGGFPPRGTPFCPPSVSGFIIGQRCVEAFEIVGLFINTVPRNCLTGQQTVDTLWTKDGRFQWQAEIGGRGKRDYFVEVRRFSAYIHAVH